jgi:hypothetical protein
VSTVWVVVSTSYDEDLAEVHGVATSEEQAQRLLAAYGYGQVAEVKLWEPGEEPPAPRYTHHFTIGSMARWHGGWTIEDENREVRRSTSWSWVLPPGQERTPRVREWRDEGGRAVSAEGYPTAEEAEAAGRAAYQAMTNA